MTAPPLQVVFRDWSLTVQTRARGQSPHGVHRYPACSPSLPRPAGKPGPCPHQPSLMLPGGDPVRPEGAQWGLQAKAECLVSHLPARHDPERKACPCPPHRPGGGCRRIYPLSEEGPGPTGPGARAHGGPADGGAGRPCGNRVTIPTSVPCPLLLPESRRGQPSTGEADAGRRGDPGLGPRPSRTGSCQSQPTCSWWVTRTTVFPRSVFWMHSSKTCFPTWASTADRGSSSR